jgi:predicted small integral membrane protein
MLFRLSKIALVAAVALFLLLVVFNNLTDYGSNYGFVSHVLAMDTTFPGNTAMWRAISSVPVYHLFYASIILWETVAMVLIATGVGQLWRARTADAATFNRAKGLVVLGLTVNLLQWLVAFLTVGAEWFLMWQSKSWNGQEAAFRMFACVALVLLFASRDDAELVEKGA